MRRWRGGASGHGVESGTIGAVPTIPEPQGDLGAATGRVGAQPPRRLRAVRRSQRRSGRSATTRRCSLVARRPRRLLGGAGRWADIPWHGRAARALADPAMPGRDVVSGRPLNHAELAPRQARRRPMRRRSCRSARRAERIELTWAELADQVARCRAGWPTRASGRGIASLRFLPNIAETTVAFLATASLGAIWSSCAPEFGVRAVTDRWSQVEPRVLFAVDGYRYGDQAIDRPAHVDEIVAALPTSNTSSGCPTSIATGEDDWSSVARSPRPRTIGAGLRAGAVRPSALRALLVGHDRPAEADRARPRRHHARTRQGAGAALRPAPRRPVLLVHHHRLDDVELPHVGRARGATVVLFDGDPARPISHAVALAADEQVDVLGVSAPFLMACRKAGLRPGDDLDLTGCAPRLHGRAAAGRRVRLDRPGRRRARADRLDERRHRRVHRVRRTGPDAARTRRRDLDADARLRRAGVAARRHPVRPRRDRRARDRAADAVDAGRFLGRRRRLAATAPPTSRLPRGVDPRRLDHVHRRWRLRDHGPLRCHPQPGRGAPRHQRLLRRGRHRCRRSPTASWSTSRMPGVGRGS